jgi:hypothetical protein
MKTSCLIPILTISLFFISHSCDAKRAYMWSDEHGIPHISDQPPPHGVDAVSFSAERDSLEDKSAVPERKQEEDAPSQKSIPEKNGSKPAASGPKGASAGELRKLPPNRDLSTLTRTERMELMILEAEKERAERLYKSASGEGEQNHWKKEIDKMKARERTILGVPVR